MKGSIDYVLQSQKNFIVIEAKKADLDRGFSQLAAELIAFAELMEPDCNCIFGAVTLGDPG